MTFSRLILLSSLLTVWLVMNLGCNRNNPNKRHSAEAVTDTAITDHLLYLPPLLSVSPNSDLSTTLILTSADVARFDDKKEAKPYVNAVQIVDADQPWPPRWYTSTPVYTDAMFNQVTKNGEYRYDMAIDAKVEAGYFSFYKILSKQKLGQGQLTAPDFAGYILLNENMEPVDTVKSNLKRSNMYFHDLRINAGGERMVDLKKDTYLDLRDYTGDSKDTAMHCNIDYIHIVDSNDKILFTWNPLQHINPELFQYKETVKKKAFAANHSDMIEWTRLTSALWDYDGDILYAMKQIGIGKISRKDGHVIWQVNYSDIPIISGKDTLEWYSPHDLNLLWDNATTATYSIYSNGDKQKNKPACGVVFEIDKRTHKFKLVKYIPLQITYFANGQGNVDYQRNGDYAVGYGFFENSDNSSKSIYRPVLEYKLTNGLHGVYELPQWIYTYKARLFKNWPLPPRPVITKNGDMLEVAGEGSDYTWYKLSGKNNTIIEQAGKGKSIKSVPRTTYCVEGKYGIGFSVSRVFEN